MPRTKYCIANWKMNFTLSDAEGFLAEWENKALNNPHIKTIFCPSFTELFAIADILKTSSSQVGAQNVFYESSGAFTGEISCSMLKEAGCQWVIIGHSERRQYHYETNELVAKKVVMVIENQMVPIICIGESKEEREKGNYLKILF